MGEGIKPIYEKLASFKRKYYLNLFIRGSLLTLSLMLVYLLIAALIEHNLWLGKGARFFIFSSFFALVALCLYRFLKQPFLFWIYRKGLGQEESARMVGMHFPSISDRLLNLLQLAEVSASNDLVQAGILQKSGAMANISFDQAVDFRENRKYIKYFAIPFILIGILWFVDGTIFTQSTKRIVQFNREFSPQAPFSFTIVNPQLIAYFDEDFTLSLQLAGTAIPDAVYIVSGQQRLKMENLKPGDFSYVFERLQHPIDFQFEAAGFYSNPFTLQLINRPELTQLKIDLQYPRYLSRKSEQLTNTGNLEIPEGTKVTWTVGSSHAKAAAIGFSNDPGVNMQMIDDQLFMFNKNFNDPQEYWIALENEHAKNKDRIAYNIRVIKDQFPEITVDHVRDSVLFKKVLLGGSISDDHGLTALQLHYSIRDENGKEGKNKSIPLEMNRSSSQQSFFYEWALDSLKLTPGDQLNYYLQVWDNDGVNGNKSTKSSIYVFALPGKNELKAEISKSQAAAESQIDQSLEKAKDLRESIEEIQEKLKGKQSLDWQDRKMLEELIQQKKNLVQSIEKLRKENSLLEDKKKSFSEENERIREKSEQIQKLMDELLDEETKKMFDELQKLLKENADLSQMQRMLEKMDRKEINLEKELERTLQLFKELQFEYKVDQALQEIKEQAKKQESLMEETKKSPEGKEANEKDSGKGDEDKEKDKGEKPTGNEEKGKDDKGAQEKGDDQKDKKDLSEKQDELNKDFEKLEQNMEELRQLGEDLQKPDETPSEQDMQDVKDSQQQSKESLDQGKNKKASEQQKKALDKMQQMQQSLEGMQNSMEMEMDMVNLESLRQIIHGLIKLSFGQESLMKDFAPIQQTDPKYVQLGQDQLKLQDDSKVLEDSLLALSKKDAFMGSIVTREVGELKDHLEKAVENIRERKKGNAGSEMQLSMTSMNNLALMLNDHFDMMMQMMANAKPSMKKGKQGKKPMNLSEMQQQLNERIDQLKKGNGKGGREMSEELARMAAEQERIRRALQEMQEQLKRDGGKAPGGDLPGKMEQTEMDLVNKQITDQTIRRQQEILTRLLETEKSMREQNQDNERKGETAKDYDKEIPRAFEEYLRLKEKEVELLKTVPPQLYPYYKKEVNEYFQRIGTQE